MAITTFVDVNQRHSELIPDIEEAPLWLATNSWLRRTGKVQYLESSLPRKWLEGLSILHIVLNARTSQEYPAKRDGYSALGLRNKGT